MNNPFSRLRKWLTTFTKVFVITFICLLAALLLYRQYLQHQVRSISGISSSHGIDTLVCYSLGGVDQWVLIRGWERDNPLLLVLHGGPGSPIFPQARAFGHQSKLEKHFTVIYWEQRGTGKSYHPSIPPESMTIERLVQDTRELVEILRNHLGFRKLYLLGRSWGSLIGLITASRYPDLFYAYIGIGQIVCPMQGDLISFRKTLQLADSLGNQEALAELQAIGPPPYYYQEILIQRKWLTRFERYSSDWNDISGGSRPGTLRKLLATPEYSLSDILRMGSDPYFSLRHLWNDAYYRINLFEQLVQVDIPVYFLAGKHDFFVPSPLVKEFFQQLKAPRGKHFIWFEKSGHQPELEEREKFYKVMMEMILPQTFPETSALNFHKTYLCNRY